MLTLNNLTPYHRSVLEVIVKKTSKDTPFSKKDIEAHMSHMTNYSRLSNRLTLTKVIHDLRINLVPICENTKGYFYARSSSDLKAFIDRYQKKIHKDQEALEALKKVDDTVVGYPDYPSNFKITVELPVRNRTGGVILRRFDVSESGIPIIPDGVEVVQ